MYVIGFALTCMVLKLALPFHLVAGSTAFTPSIL
jgi:hypothetical protein